MLASAYPRLFGAVAFFCVCAGPTVGQEIEFRGICDGSAAVALDDQTLLVAYDESNRLYSVLTSGDAVARSKKLKKELGLTAKGEMDLEGAARDGDRIWWIGSHGTNKSGEPRENRRALFATNVPSADLKDLKPVDGPADLLPVLTANAELAEILTAEILAKPPKQGGLNIEGLAVHPDGGLLLGLRAPLTGTWGVSGKALLVHIQQDGGDWQVRGVHRLDLVGRGVRDLARDGDDILILAGAVDEESPFALYRWDGAGTPTEIDATALQGIRPEALVQVGAQWLALSDDGKLEREGETCDKIREEDKDDRRVFFRGRAFAP